MATTEERLIPTGWCWCNCGGEASIGAFFIPGHDKVLEARIIATHYGSVARFALAHGHRHPGPPPANGSH